MKIFSFIKSGLTGRFLKAAGITALAFLLSTVLLSPLSTSVSAMFSTPERNDFTLSDFYNIVADSRAVSYLDTNIVIVNIDRSDRDEIADIINICRLAGAKAVGLDVMFGEPRETDAPLLEAMMLCPALVQPLVVDPTASSDTFAIKATSYYYAPDSATHIPSMYAAASLPSRYERSMVREMRVEFPTEDGHAIPSMALALAREADPEKAEALVERGNRYEIITYHSRRFVVLEPDQLLDHADLLTDRVVLIGAMTENSDLHQTPVDYSMPGVLIHAHSLATILDEAYMTSVPKWVGMLIASLLCFIIILLSVTVTGAAKGLLIRFVQIAFVWGAVQLGYWFFVSKNIVLDFSYALLMLAFGLFACDVWNGSVTLFTALLRRFREMRAKRRKQS